MSEQENKQSKENSTGYAIPIKLALFVLFVGFVTIEFVSWQKMIVLSSTQKKQEQQLSHAINEEHNIIQSNHQVLEDLSNSHAMVSKKVLELNQAISANRTAINSLHKQHNENTPTKWLLNEIDYQVNLARIKSLYEYDFQSAKKLLQDANHRLAKNGERKYQPLQDALVEDIARVSQFEAMDYSLPQEQLQHLKEAVPKLFSLEEQLAQQHHTVSNLKQQSQSATTWQEKVQNAFGKLESIIRLQKRNSPINPILTQNEIRLLNKQLGLMLTEAEFYLIQKKPQLLINKLDEVELYLNNYADNDSERVIVFRETLAQLKKAENIAIPKIEFSSLHVLSTLENIPQEPHAIKTKGA